MAQDPSENEVASFTIGKGRADWAPLTLYAVMKSGDIYAVCPYLPQNACVEHFDTSHKPRLKRRQLRPLSVPTRSGMFCLQQAGLHREALIARYTDAVSLL
jgi:hypothetical protein